ncbi:helix-turn-helix transcriptional regulator [Lysobacter niabensis]|uniref:helix-turn-helix transcriptional regulator n=1 Tax=Agrilutibacter niabensis TaxID=380628 RepID=UPI003608D9F8
MLEIHSLRLAEHLDLSHSGPSQSGSEKLHLVYAGHRGTRLELPHGWVSLWLPLRGEVQLESALCRWTLRGQLLIAREGHVQGSANADATWLALAGPNSAWKTWLAPASTDRHASELLPRQWPCPRGLRRQLVHLARIARGGCAAPDRDAALQELCASLLEQQRDLQPLLDRCSGRTPQRRLLTLQRLLRVHALVERGSDAHLDLRQLASSASYSPWHLIRMYRDVFGETPSEHIVRLRLSRAWSLVRDSALPVCEITEQLGFESPSAFCRAFKNAYGLTATQARHLPALAARQASPRPSHARPRTRPAPRPLSALR